MNLRHLLRAQRRGDKVPTLERISRSGIEQERAAQGLCTGCGEGPPSDSSYLCEACEGELSMEDIRAELRRLREQMRPR